MSQENVELHHRLYDAFNRRHLAAVMALMADDVESGSLVVGIEGGYHGPDGMRRLWEDLLNATPDLNHRGCRSARPWRPDRCKRAPSRPRRE